MTQLRANYNQTKEMFLSCLCLVFVRSLFGLCLKLIEIHLKPGQTWLN
jgi:hypothetical protein